MNERTAEGDSARRTTPLTTHRLLQLVRRRPDGDWTTGLSMLGVGAAAAVASFDNQRRFAVECGWSPQTGWLLPVCLDLYAVTALRLWLRAGSARSVRLWAAISGWLAVVLSVAGNAVQHAISLGYLLGRGDSPHVGIVIAVAAVPPVMLALLVHLESLRRTTSQAPSVERAEAVDASGDDGGGGEHGNELPGRRRSRRVTAQRSLVEAALKHRHDALTKTPYVLGGELAAEVGGHPQTIRRYVRQWQEDQRQGAGVLELVGAAAEGERR